MVQSVDSVNKQNYNAVKINIQKPQVNGLPSNGPVQTDNGDYSAVNINIDNPSVNVPEHKIYDYPQAQTFVPYDMANVNTLPLPQGFHVAYQTTNLILPKMENELEVETGEDEKAKENSLEEDVALKDGEDAAPAVENKAADVVAQTDVETPAPNYTTVDAEKGEEKDNVKNATVEENVENKVEETEVNEVKKPEIVPGEEIKPDVDIPLVISNLTNEDFNVQAQQMEEIVRVSLENEQNAIPYIVRDVFSSLIDITKKDTSELPYSVKDKDSASVGSVSPMEQAEKNKEYALVTMAILAKVYTDEIEKQTGNIVPMTDIPGAAAIVDSLRYSTNSGVKIASIDALRHIYKPEYKEEMSTLFTLAQADTNPDVAEVATIALNNINN